MLFVLALGLWLQAEAAATILKPVANMFSKPSREADVVSQAIYGTRVDVIERRSGWARIRTPDEYLGWTEESDLRLGDSRYPGPGRTVEVRSLFAHLYLEPSVTKRAPKLTVPFETRLEVVAEPTREEGRWIQVRLVDDSAAWVQRGDVTFDPKPLSIQEMIELSRMFLGLPYTWGGTSSFGFDCSGFTQMLCRRRGIRMPRDAAPQAKWTGMVEVAKADLRPGDLVYFGPASSKITHTGLYIGDGKFIHATTNQRPVVQISELADQHWTSIYVGARRPK
jgi:hypothetical protein